VEQATSAERAQLRGDLHPDSLPALGEAKASLEWVHGLRPGPLDGPMFAAALPGARTPLAPRLPSIRLPGRVVDLGHALSISSGLLGARGPPSARG
jgi:hypothetical protein